MTRFAGFFLIFGLIAAAIFMHSSIRTFIDPPSIIIVLGIVVGGGLASFPPSRLSMALRDAFSSGSIAPDQAKSSSRVFFRLSELAIGAGLTGTLVGLVMMLQAMDDPTAIGPAMAVALLTLLYGVLLSEIVFRSFAADILVRGESEAQAGETPLESHRGERIALPLFIVISCFFVMLLAMGAFFDDDCEADDADYDEEAAHVVEGDNSAEEADPAEDADPAHEAQPNDATEPAGETAPDAEGSEGQ